MNLPAIRHARYIYEHKVTLTRDELLLEAVALAEWGLFSARHIAAITGLRRASISPLIGKVDRTGGRFNPSALRLLQRLAQSKYSAADLRAVQEHCGPAMIERLTGVSAWKLRRAKAAA